MKRTWAILGLAVLLAGCGAPPSKLDVGALWTQSPEKWARALGEPIQATESANGTENRVYAVAEIGKVNLLVLDRMPTVARVVIQYPAGKVKDWREALSKVGIDPSPARVTGPGELVQVENTGLEGARVQFRRNHPDYGGADVLSVVRI